MVQGIIAGGMSALLKAREGAEDSETLAVDDLKAQLFSTADVLVGIAASGRTPYVIGGLRYARSLGAACISLTCSPASPMEALADIPLTVATGAEVITGSTRMKAGTAQKLMLNMISTAVMIRLGRVEGNKMVNMQLTNNKLVDRGNTVIVIEHNLDVIKVADHIIDIGPEGGAAGGEIVAAGTPHEIACSPRSYTGEFLKKLGL